MTPRPGATTISLAGTNGTTASWTHAVSMVEMQRWDRWLSARLPQFHHWHYGNDSLVTRLLTWDMECVHGFIVLCLFVVLTTCELQWIYATFFFIFHDCFPVTGISDNCMIVIFRYLPVLTTLPAIISLHWGICIWQINCPGVRETTLKNMDTGTTRIHW